MIKEAIEKVLTLATPNYKEIESVLFSDKKMFEVKPEKGPEPKDLKISTLSGVVDYIKNNLDDEDDYVVHVSNHKNVELYGQYNPDFCTRKNYVSATVELSRFPFGQYLDPESFIISVQSYLAPNETMSKLLEKVGNISDDSSLKLLDDGVSQGATIKVGVVGKADIVLPNPVELIPYETFPEIDGITRKFVFRLKKGSRGIECALFESGDTKWKIEYIQLIKKYFEEQLKSEKKHISIIA